MKCAMQNEWVDGLTTNHSPTPLPERKQMQALHAEEMESSSKINLRDVSWWMSIKKFYRLEASVIAKLSKERCISLVARRRSFHTAHKHD
jgi:hypothetical protein